MLRPIRQPVRLIIYICSFFFLFYFAQVSYFLEEKRVKTLECYLDLFRKKKDYRKLIYFGGEYQKSKIFICSSSNYKWLLTVVIVKQ